MINETKPKSLSFEIQDGINLSETIPIQIDVKIVASI